MVYDIPSCGLFFNLTLHHCEIELNLKHYILSWAATLGFIKKGNLKAKLKKASDIIYSLSTCYIVKKMLDYGSKIMFVIVCIIFVCHVLCETQNVSHHGSQNII